MNKSDIERIRRRVNGELTEAEVREDIATTLRKYHPRYTMKEAREIAAQMIQQQSLQHDQATGFRAMREALRPESGRTLTIKEAVEFIERPVHMGRPVRRYRKTQYEWAQIRRGSFLKRWFDKNVRRHQRQRNGGLNRHRNSRTFANVKSIFLQLEEDGVPRHKWVLKAQRILDARSGRLAISDRQLRTYRNRFEGEFAK